MFQVILPLFWLSQLYETISCSKYPVLTTAGKNNESPLYTPACYSMNHTNTMHTRSRESLDLFSVKVHASYNCHYALRD